MSKLPWLILIKNIFTSRWVLKTLFKFPSLKQFIKFSLVGLVNTLIDFIIYFALTRLITWFADYYLVANAIAFAVAATNSFYLNKYWTFQSKDKRQITFQYFKFLLVSIFTLILVEAFLYLFVNYLGMFDLYAKVLVIIISLISNFFLNKLIVFKT